MFIIRNRRALRIFSVFSMLVFINQLLFPTVSYALTSGPNQPEYTSYEDAASSDMVNLLTGDFAFNLPILTVPNGTEAGFSLPLSYHAGIGLDQEASWIGLGWNINVGSISRGVNGFPDDASGESQVVNVSDLSVRRGWSASIIGSGTALGWDSQVGHYGTLNLGPKLRYNESQASFIGLTMSDGKMSNVDPIEFGITVVQVVMAIASYGATEWAAEAVSGTISQIQSDFSVRGYIPSAGSNGYWAYTREKERKLFYTNYWIWLDQTRVEDMYGTLFLDKASQLSSPETDYTNDPFHLQLRANINGVAQTIKQFPMSTTTLNKGAASDITIDLSGDDYKNNNSPALLAYDNYQVNGPGISGSIKPYRLETGTVSVPREMTSFHKRLNLVPYLDYGTSKVPFVYEGDIGNRYYHHNGGATAASINTYFGVSTEKQTGGTGGDILQYNLNDATLGNERIRADVASTKKIPQGRSVEWMSNGEIKNTPGAFANNTFLDYATGSERTSFRSNYDFGGRVMLYGTSYDAQTGNIAVTSSDPVVAGSTVDVVFVMEYTDGNSVTRQNFFSYPNLNVRSTTATGIRLNDPIQLPPSPWVLKRVDVSAKNVPKQDNMIGGFAVTAENGMTYHYAIPVYDYDFFSKTTNSNDVNKYSTVTRGGQFANTWLLTAITGPDFVDRGGANNAGNGTVDTNDWGYWVKFNYGSHRPDYRWRIPYTGEKVSSDETYTTYAQGATELYYLNSIETRTHVAMFIKDSRRDNRDASADKKSSLRLGEIALLTRENYTALTDASGSYGLRDCSGVRNVVYQYNGSTGSAISGAVKTYIEDHALRRVVFNIDYQLCPGVLNSDTGYGKLTLQSVSILGRNNVKLFPDYKFTYGNNPSYAIDRWDGWGMYSSLGKSTGFTHGASEIQADGAAWSLTSVKSPLGNIMAVEYERDDYGSISGVVDIPPRGDVFALDTDLSDGVTTIPSPIFKDGEPVIVESTEYYTCDEPVCQGQDGITYPCPVDQSRVAATLNGVVQGNTVILDNPYVSHPGTTVCSNGATVPTTPGTVVVRAKYNTRKGGNLRVKTITLRDDFLGTAIKTRYVYTQDSNIWGKSSGVVSVEPDYISFVHQDFYDWMGYPVTPVLYGKVAVLTGKLTDDNDYDSKQVYEFITPHKNQYESNIAANYVQHNQQVATESYNTLLFNTILSRSSMIGKLKSIKQYDRGGNLYANQDFVYTVAPLNDGVMNYQGVSTEGTLLFDVIAEGAARYYRTMRTEFMRYPYVLKKVITTVDGQTTIHENQNWDTTTGQVLVSDEKTPLGVTLRTIQSPAYLQYPELGSKATNASNKNMLTQMATSYTYRLDNTGQTSGLVGASASVWRKDWSNYRKPDTNGVYINTSDLDQDGNGTVSAAEAKYQIWRPYASYVWKGDYARSKPDGTQTFADADKFSFTAGAANVGWQKTGSKERYNHNSALLESKDMNGMRSATKLGYNDQFTIASAARSGYEEMAFSSAEDRLSNTSAYFGGEVGLGSGSVVTAPVHTGKQALSVAASGTGFVYRSSGVRPGTTVYRASVWCSSAQGRIYYRVNGGSMVTPTPVVSAAVTLPGGTWYRIETEFSLGSVTAPALEVGVTTASGTAVFDDFRFQPRDAGMTCYVYNPDTQQVEYVLGNDNLYTRYEYNARGVLTKTYKETIQYGGEKLITETKDDFRRFHIDQ